MHSVAFLQDLAVVMIVAGLVTAAQLPTRLRDCQVPCERLAKLAEFAAKQWTGTFNPRPVGVPELLAIYEQAY